MLQGLRIPIIRLYGNIIVPIQAALSDDLVKQLKNDVTGAIERFGPRGLVIDVSGIGVMDTFITRTIRDVALMARLMGTRTVISGLDPMVAITLIEMGMDLKGVITELNLEAALDHLSRLQRVDHEAVALSLTQGALDDTASPGPTASAVATTPTRPKGTVLDTVKE